jgi:hypothetical protein
MTARLFWGTPASATRKQAPSRKQGETVFLLVLGAAVLALLVASAAFAPVSNPDATSAGAEWIIGP